MQRLSMIALTAVAVLGLSGTGFTTRPNSSPPNPAVPESLATKAPNSQAAFANSYYWYSTIDGSYNDYETVAYEIWEMEIYWGVIVNQNAAGGTLIEEGFWSENPNMPVMIWLYGHF